MDRERARVLFHPFFFLSETWNGVDEHLRLLAAHLDTERYELLVLAHESDGPQTGLLAKRAQIRLVPAPYPPGASAPARLPALRALYRRELFDIVHLHSPVAGGQAVPALAARLAGAAVVATYHQIQPKRLPARSRVVNFLTHSLLVSRTAAVSGDVRSSLASEAGLPKERVRVIHNGIEASGRSDLEAPLPEREPGEVRLAYFGRLSPEKGLAGLLGGLALLAERAPSVRTLIVGEGPQRAELEATAERLGLAERVYFLGFRADARAIMERVDVVVHTPAYEGFGLVMLEAMAAGRPVVACDAPGGMREVVVHGKTGVIVPTGSAEALAEALTRLAGDADERERFGRCGRERCEKHFSARRMAERVSEMYEETLGRRRERSQANPASAPSAADKRGSRGERAARR